MSERDYIKGSKAAFRIMLAECLRNLGDAERNAHSWRLEREHAIAILRDVCKEHGDNDWDDDLYLGDIIEKHLGRHLE